MLTETTYDHLNNSTSLEKALVVGWYISYFDVVVMKYNDQGNLQREVYLGLKFQRDNVLLGRMAWQVAARAKS